MRRLLPIIGIIVVILGIALYGAVWHMQAKNAEAEVRAQIARINSDIEWITFKEIRTTGFPGDVSVEITNPVFSGRIDPWLQKLADMLPVAPDGTPNAELKAALTSPPEWQERLSLDGTISLSTNLFSNHFTLKTEGTSTEESTIGEQKQTMRTEMAGAQTCELHIQRDNSAMLKQLWDFGKIAETPDSFKENFRSLNCQIPAFTSTNTATAEKLVQADASSFAVSASAPANGQRLFGLSLNLNNLEALPAMDALAGQMRSVFAGNKADTETAKVLSAYGKQNIHIDMSWNGPSSAESFSSSTPFELQVKRADISNALYSTQNSAAFARKLLADDNISIVAQLHSESNFTEAYDNQLAESIKEDMADFLTHEELLKETPFANTTQEQMNTLFLPLVPKLHDLGKTVIGLDATYAGKQDMSQGDSVLKQLELSFAPYGITANGKAAITPPIPSPAGNVTLNCRNCITMVEDLTSWLLKVKAALAQIDPAITKQNQFTPEVAQGIKRFLQELGTPAANDSFTLVYAISAPAPNELTVNGKSMSELSVMLGKSIDANSQEAPHAQ